MRTRLWMTVGYNIVISFYLMNTGTADGCEERATMAVGLNRFSRAAARILWWVGEPLAGLPVAHPSDRTGVRVCAPNRVRIRKDIRVKPVTQQDPPFSGAGHSAHSEVRPLAREAPLRAG